MINYNNKIIDGAKIASKICNFVEQQIISLKENNIIPGLAVILVGNDPASSIYVSRKKEIARALGISSHVIHFPEDITERNLLNKIEFLNNDPKINGILVQLPLPNHLNKKNILDSIDPKKDVDGLTPSNVGKLVLKDNDVLAPCTPQGCLILIRTVLKEIEGLNAVVVGRSSIVGSPIATILLNNNCTVTTVHSKTYSPKEFTSKADILVVAAGSPELIKKDWVKKGSVVIDVGINRLSFGGKGKLVGDVDFDDVIDKVGFITPVPKGVGPMTIACLMKNTVRATCIQKNIDLKVTQRY